MRSPCRGLEKLEANGHAQLKVSWKAEEEEKIQENRAKQALGAQTLGATNLKREDNDLGPREGTDFPEQAES